MYHLQILTHQNFDSLIGSMHTSLVELMDCFLKLPLEDSTQRFTGLFLGSHHTFVAPTILTRNLLVHDDNVQFEVWL